MRIGILSQWFDPEPGPAAIPGVLAREFAAAGHEVSVLTGFPNYPTGRLYPGFKQRWRQTTQTGGITITRVPLVASHDSSALRRAANYVSFALSATLFGGKALRGCDVVWVYNSPVSVALPLSVHTHDGRLPYFLHVQDLWPDSLAHSGMFPEGRSGRVALSVISKVVAHMERRAHCIGVISPSVVDLITQRNTAVSRDRIHYVPNPTDEELFRPSQPLPRTIGEPFVLMYSGALGDVQGLDTVIRAVAALPTAVDLRLVLVGDGIARQRLEALAAELDLTGRIKFVGRVEKSRVPELMHKAHAHLVSLAPSGFLEHTTPSKIPSLLASSAAILGVIAGDGARLILESGAGPVVSPGDEGALGAALVSMARMSTEELASLGASGRRHYDLNFSAAHVAAIILGEMSPDLPPTQATKDLS